MNPCLQSFLDFCPSDRVSIIILVIVLIGVGYIIGTDGHWNRFYWKTKDTIHTKGEMEGKDDK